MRVFIICSKFFYDKIPAIKAGLEANGHVVTLQNAYDDPKAEERFRALGPAIHAEWKASMLRQSAEIIERMDAVLVLNFEKNGTPHYIGGATFIEMYDAFRLSKKIFLYNPIPEGILKDEILGFAPIIIAGDLQALTSA
jgi:hypothetical protein